MTLLGLGRSQARSSASRLVASAAAASTKSIAAPTAVMSSRYSSTSTKSGGIGNGPMYEGQSSMPHLPVPKLEQTLEKYLRTTIPHQTKESLAKTEKAVQSALSVRMPSSYRSFRSVSRTVLPRRAVKAGSASGGTMLPTWLTVTRCPLRQLLLLAQGRQDPPNRSQACCWSAQGFPCFPQTR